MKFMFISSLPTAITKTNNLRLYLLPIPPKEIHHQCQDAYTDNGTNKSAKQKLEIIPKRVKLEQETIELFEKPHTQNHCANQYEIVGVPFLRLYIEISTVLTIFRP